MAARAAPAMSRAPRPYPPIMRTMLLPILAAAAMALPAAAEPRVETLAIGAAAPDFSLPGTDGRTWRLADFADAKALVVVFTCNHCPDARAASGRIRALDESFRDRGVRVVAISGNDPLALRLDETGYSVWGDSFEEMKHHAREHQWAFPYLYDGETQAATRAYGAQATPHAFVFDAARRLRYTGRLDDGGRNPAAPAKSQVRDAIEAVLAGRDPDPATTRPVGCSTKWAWKRDSVQQDNETWAARPVELAELDAAGAGKLRANRSGNLRLVNLWMLGCTPCLAEFPDLVDTYRRFQGRPFELVTISIDPPADHAKALELLRRNHAAVADHTAESLAKEGRTTNNFRFTGDPDALAEALDAEWNGALPHSLLVAPGGAVVWRHTGRVNPVELRRAIVGWLERNG